MDLTNKIILGTVQFGLNYGIHNQSGKMSQEEISKVLLLAHENNIRILDTADAYGDSQQQIGLFQKNKNIQFHILTKYKGVPADELKTHTNKVLQTLHSPKLACLSLHDFKELSDANLMSGYRDLKNLGLTEKIGVSVYTPDECLTALKHEFIDVIQIPFNVLDNENRWHKAFEYKAKLNRKVEVHARSSFLQGLLYKNSQQINSDTPYLADLIPSMETLRKVAEEYKKSLAEYSLSYCLQNKNINSVLIGVDSAMQLQNNLNCIKKTLEPEAFDVVSKIKINNERLINPSQWPSLKENHI